MCEFLSFVLDVKNGALGLYCADLTQHTVTNAFYSLNDNTLHECEWTEDDDGESLVIRLTDEESHKDRLYREWILSHWPKRSNLLDFIIANFDGENLDLSGTGITELPEGLSVGGYLDLSGTGITNIPRKFKTKF